MSLIRTVSVPIGIRFGIAQKMRRETGFEVDDAVRGLSLTQLVRYAFDSVWIAAKKGQLIKKMKVGFDSAAETYHTAGRKVSNAFKT